MPEFRVVEVEETPYLYVTKTCSMAPSDISEAMSAAFQEVWSFMQSKGIQPAGGALSVYHSYSPPTLTFRAGFIVAPDDMQRANDEVKADTTPAGQVLHFLHKGPYRTLRDDYDQMMQHVSGLGRRLSPPTWEVYVNDPNEAPEDELMTEVYAVLA